MKENAGAGIGFFGLMFLLFLGLKLGKVITWSWWWVTAPLWGPFALLLTILIVILIIGGLVWYFSESN